MSNAPVDVETLEVVPGFEHHFLQGQVFEPANESDLRDAIEKAFDYRGDVTIHLKDGTSVEGYIFDRNETSLRLFPKGDPTKRTIPYADIKGLAFTGRDTAAGKSWEAWLKKYWEKKLAGEQGIELTPEALD